MLDDYDTYRGFLIGATKDLQEFDPAYGLAVECTNHYVSFRLESFFKPTKGTELALELGLNPPGKFQYRITNGRVVEREEHAISTSPTLGLNGRLFAFNVFKAGFFMGGGAFYQPVKIHYQRVVTGSSDDTAAEGTFKGSTIGYRIFSGFEIPLAGKLSLSPALECRLGGVKELKGTLTDASGSRDAVMTFLPDDIGGYRLVPLPPGTGDDPRTRPVHVWLNSLHWTMGMSYRF